MPFLLSLLVIGAAPRGGRPERRRRLQGQRQSGSHRAHGRSGDLRAAKGGDDVLLGRGGGDRLKGGSGGRRRSAARPATTGYRETRVPISSHGGPGNDQLSDKSPQGDRANAGAGDDQIDLRDGVMANDEAVGGPGTDICLVDALDTVTECENPVVATPAPPAPPPPPRHPNPPKPPNEPPGPSKLQIGAVTDTPDPTHFGEEITFTVLVENTGPGTATGVNLHASKASAFNRPFVEFESPSTCSFTVEPPERQRDRRLPACQHRARSFDPRHPLREGDRGVHRRSD